MNALLHSPRPSAGTFVGVALALLLGGPEAAAELSPMRVIEGNLVKPELMIVLDTSGSMDDKPNGGDAGADCNYDEGPGKSGVTADIAVDLLGDGLCSGAESSSTDCIGRTNVAGPGSPRQCINTSDSGASRAYQTKRVLRSLLPELRAAANFGLVTFDDSGQYQYYEADSAFTCQPCTGGGSSTPTCSQATCTAATTTCPADHVFDGWDSSSGTCRCRKTDTGWVEASYCRWSTSYYWYRCPDWGQYADDICRDKWVWCPDGSKEYNRSDTKWEGGKCWCQYGSASYQVADSCTAPDRVPATYCRAGNGTVGCHIDYTCNGSTDTVHCPTGYHYDYTDSWDGSKCTCKKDSGGGGGTVTMVNATYCINAYDGKHYPNCDNSYACNASSDQVTCPAGATYNSSTAWNSSTSKCQCEMTGTPPVCSDPEDMSTCVCTTSGASGPPRLCKGGTNPCCGCPSSDWKLSCSDEDADDCKDDGGCKCTKKSSKTNPKNDCGANCSHLSGYTLHSSCSRDYLSNSCTKWGCRKWKCVWWHGRQHCWVTDYKAPQYTESHCPPVNTDVCSDNCPDSSLPEPTSEPAVCTLPEQKATTFFLSETEIKSLGLWDTTNNRPKSTCDPSKDPCGYRSDDWYGAKLTLLSAVDTSVDGYGGISDTVKTKDSLYRCSVDPTQQRRFNFASKSQTHSTNVDGCKSWVYLGSYYTYLQRKMLSASDSDDCGSSQKCHRQADYRGPQYTADDKTYVYRRLFATAPDRSSYDQGHSWNDAGKVWVGLEPTQTAEAQGQVVDQMMRYFSSTTNGGFFFYGGTPTGAAIKTAGDHFVARQEGSSPFESDDKDYYASCRPRFALMLSDGQSNYGTDPEIVARKLFKGSYLSDQYSGWDKLTKYDDAPDNPIKTLVVGIPGLSSDARSELHRTAKSGWDGTDCSGGCKNHVDYCKNKIAAGDPVPEGCAFISNDEKELTRSIRSAVYDLVAGDYTTAAVGVASSNVTQMVGNLAMVPSTTYPGWRGQLRAFDLSAEGDAVAQWDAGQRLGPCKDGQAAPDCLPDSCVTKRPLYTGHPGYMSGTAVPLFDADNGYAVNVAPLLAVVSAAGVTLPEEMTKDDNAKLKALVRWLAGVDRQWRLPPIFRCTPATIGDPPEHSKLTIEGREQLAYVTSNEGWLHAFRVADGTEAFSYIAPTSLSRVFELYKNGGQEEDPQNFRWITASSPRIDDVPTDGSGGNWRTRLYFTMGPGGQEIVALDVTNPVTCDPRPETVPACWRPCNRTTDFFTVKGYSQGTGAPAEMADKLGETWSLPSIFYDKDRNGASVAMGSGYPLAATTGSRGNHYLALTANFSTLEATEHTDPAASGAVDYAVLADTAAEAGVEGRIIATYQADLGGRVIRYPDGEAYTSPVTPAFCTANPDKCVLNVGADHPFFYSPAVYPSDSGATYIAALSGSSRERDQTAVQEPMVYVLKRLESGITELAKFAIGDLCDQFLDGAKPTDCTAIAPSGRARPVGSPFIIDNDVGAGSTEIQIFALFYEPPPPENPCGRGYSYTIRFAVDLANPDKKLISIEKDEGQAGGMTIVGGGTNVAVVLSGAGDEAATVKKVIDTALPQAPTLGPGKASVESWKEIRY